MLVPATLVSIQNINLFLMKFKISRSLLTKYVVQILGLSEEMYDDGYQNIVNIDISFTVIKQMQELYKDKYPNMPYKQMDVKALAFQDNSFEAVIDKGTLDSILCGDGSGPNAAQMLSEIYRVLSPNGVYICISYGVKD